MLENFEEVKELVESGVEINAQDQDGNTPLHFASLGGNCKIVNYLIDHGSNIGIQNNLNVLPLDYLNQEQIRQIESQGQEFDDHGRVEVESAPLSHPDHSRFFADCTMSSGEYDEALSRGVYSSDFSKTSSEGSESSSEGSEPFSSYSESSSEGSELASDLEGFSSGDSESSINYTESPNNIGAAFSYSNVLTYEDVKLITWVEINFSDFDC